MYNTTTIIIMWYVMVVGYLVWFLKSVRFILVKHYLLKGKVCDLRM